MTARKTTTKVPQWKQDLKAKGLNDVQIGDLVVQGAEGADDIALLSADQIVEITGCGKIVAARIEKAFAAKSEEDAGQDTKKGDDQDEDPGKVAKTLGVAPDMLNMLLVGQLAGNDMDLSDVFPIAQIVAGYDPKRRGIWTNMMNRIAERHHGVPIVVINHDGTVNAEATSEYIEELETGFPPTGNTYENNQTVYEVIAVGMDSTAVFDEDPLVPGAPLRKNKGIGRINWTSVPLNVRQVVRIAVESTHEIDAEDAATQRMLRNLIGDDTALTDLDDEMPKAIAEFHRRSRTGNLPQLKTTINAVIEGASPVSGSPFRRDSIRRT